MAPPPPRVTVGSLLPGEVAILGEDVLHGGTMYQDDPERHLLPGATVMCLWHVHEWLGQGAAKKRGPPRLTFVDLYDDWTFRWPREPKSIRSDARIVRIVTTRVAGVEPTHASGDPLDPLEATHHGRLFDLMHRR